MKIETFILLAVTVAFLLFMINTFIFASIYIYYPDKHTVIILKLAAILLCLALFILIVT